MTNTKSLGQYFTPAFIVEFMISLITKGSKTRKILEPSAGKGIFLEKLTKNGYQNLMGLEIDPDIAKFSSLPIRIINFFDFPVSEKFDIIIGNPPYVRWKNLNMIQRQYLSSASFWQKRMNGLADILQPFIFKCVDHLKDEGELIFITPFFWTQTLHAEPLRRFLIDNGSLELLINFNEARIFPKVNLNLIIFKYRKTLHKKPIKVVNYHKKGKISNKITFNIKEYLENESKWESESIIIKGLEFFQINQPENSQPWNFLPRQTEKQILKFEESCLFSQKINVNGKKIKITDYFSKEDLPTFGYSKKSCEKIKIGNKSYYHPQKTKDLTKYLKKSDKKPKYHQKRYAKIGDIAEIGNGMVSGLDKAFRLDSNLVLNNDEKKFIIPVVKAKAIHRYYSEYLTDYFLIKPNQIPSEEILESKYPSIYYHLQKFREALEKRYQYNRHIPYYEWVFIRNYKLMKEANEKLICVPCKDRFDSRGYLRFALCENGTFATQDVTVLIKFKWIKESVEYITAFLNSSEVYKWVINKGFIRGGVAEFSEEPLKAIPFRFINWNSAFEVNIHNKVKEIVKSIYIHKKENKILIFKINSLISKLLDENAI